MYENVTYLEFIKKRNEMLNDFGRVNNNCTGVSCSECPLCVDCKCILNSYPNPEQELKIVMEYEPKVDWSKVPIDTKVLVRDFDKWIKRYFAKYENNRVYTWMNGSTSFSNDNIVLTSWDQAKLYKED